MDNEKLIKEIISSNNGKINQKDVNSAVKGDLSGLISSLSAEDKQKLNAALSSKEEMNKILSSDAAQKLLKLFGGK